VDGEAKADGPVRLEVGSISGDVVENVSWMLVEAENGCFEVDGGLKVVVLGQLVWIDKDMGWEGIESMERTVRRERGERETREEGGMETR